MGRQRTRQELVRAGEVSALVPRAAGGAGDRHDAVAGLRGPRLLSGNRLRARLAAKAAELGFSDCRIVRPDAAASSRERLAGWLAEGAQGDMGWMAETQDRRGDPKTLWPDVKSIVMLGMNYGPDEDPRAVNAEGNVGAISVYARHRDYHDIVKGRLKMLAQWLLSAAREAGFGDGDVKVFVDTAPVMEKPLAAAAGLGWQGRHTNLVSREFGSWLFLGSVFTTLDLEPDEAERDHCGSCRACLDACPTAAFPAPYRLDARRCISYLTIEHQGHIDVEFRAAMGNRIYGCDDCLAVCPWNKFAQQAHEAKLVAREDLKRPALAMLVMLDDAGFRTLFSGSPIKRVGHARFLRNVLIAIGNSGDVTLLPHVLARLGDGSALVRAMAVWALKRLAAPADIEAARVEAALRETDPDVLAEWSRRPG